VVGSLSLRAFELPRNSMIDDGTAMGIGDKPKRLS
jgi:hypothetical protein